MSTSVLRRAGAKAARRRDAPPAGTVAGVERGTDDRTPTYTLVVRERVNAMPDYTDDDGTEPESDADVDASANAQPTAVGDVAGDSDEPSYAEDDDYEGATAGTDHEEVAQGPGAYGAAGNGSGTAATALLWFSAAGAVIMGALWAGSMLDAWTLFLSDWLTLAIAVVAAIGAALTAAGMGNGGPSGT